MTQPYVFISYSRKDRAFVDRLASELNAAGVQTWVDTQDIAAGLNWQEEIERGLFRADALLHVASQHSAGAKWLEVELMAFLSKKGRVVPLIVDDEGAAQLPAILRTIQWIDFRTDFDQAIQLLLRGIQSLRGNKPVPERVDVSKGYVFISYATEDRDFVMDLKAFLARRGYTFWDFHTSKRNYQIDYTLELEERIRDAEATLSVISPDWKKSKTALQELHFSNEVETPVFLLRLKDPGPTLALAGRTFIDFTQSQAESFLKLADEMLDVGL
jgi:TIR domain